METNHANFFLQMDYLISEVLVIKEILIPRIKKTDEDPKYLTLEEAIAFLHEKRIRISESKLYKLTSSNKIPFCKAGNRLIFYSEELTKWSNNQIINPSESKQTSSLTIIKSALKKETNYGK